MAQKQERAKDPVCGMEISPSDAAGRIRHQGRDYYFCSQVCRSSFEQDRDQYAGTREGAESAAGVERSPKQENL
jgi:Cu+-exporting ATPase